MGEEIKIYFDEDDIAKEYDDTYDITIHCESEEEQNELLDRLNRQWIPVKYRPMTEEEKKDYSERTGYDIEDLDFTLDCPLPEDGETVLITDRLGNVIVDTFINDCDGCYFECNCDMDDITAWMPLPEPYKTSPTGEEVQNDD